MSENSSAPPPDGGDDPRPLSVGAPAELREGERRVALTPGVVAAYAKLGATVVVEAGAGEAAGFPDAAYEEKGAVVGTRDDAFGADIVTCVRVLGGDAGSPDAGRLRAGQAVVGMAAPLAAPEVSAAVAARGATLFSLELLPRTTRAQSMDVLSSQANIAGYRAVLLAAEALPKVFPLLTTAAGTIPPARVFVVGAGVAGLSAIATARRLGAVVEAYDVREAAKEEVQSLGARFVELPLETGQEGSGLGRLRDGHERRGAGAPARAHAEDRGGERRRHHDGPGAGRQGAGADHGGDGRGHEPRVGGGRPRRRAGRQRRAQPARPHRGRRGVSVIGPIDVLSSVPHHASLMYAKNVANFAALLVRDGALALDTDDDLVAGCTVARDGEVVNERVREALGAEEGVAS